MRRDEDDEFASFLAVRAIAEYGAQTRNPIQAWDSTGYICVRLRNDATDGDSVSILDRELRLNFLLVARVRLNRATGSLRRCTDLLINEQGDDAAGSYPGNDVQCYAGVLLRNRICKQRV